MPDPIAVKAADESRSAEKCASCRSDASENQEENDGDWNPEDYHDTYHEDLLKLIDKRIKAGETEVISTTEVSEQMSQAQEVVDLMALLVEQRTEHKGRSFSHHRAERR